jgi:hypothetical protein
MCSPFGLGKICIPDLPKPYFQEIDRQSQMIPIKKILKVKSKMVKGKSQKRDSSKLSVLLNEIG